MEITKIKGINEKREQEFNKSGIYDTSDMVNFFPRSYLDLREKQLLKYAYDNDFVLTAGRIVSIPVNRVYYRGKGIVKVVCEQEGLIFEIVWFNQPYVLSKLKAGEEYLFYGRVNNREGRTRLVNPSFELCEKVYRLKGIVPQYAVKGNLSQKIVRDSIKLAVDLEKPKSAIPFELQKKYQLSDLFSAYKNVHNPESTQAIAKASDRIATEEYFKLISAFKILKGGREQVRLNRYSCTAEELKDFIKQSFPFEFTNGQNEAVKDIFNDLKGEKVMNRLVQGDVGSGKTAVSVCAFYMAVKSGYQAVMLAPTEVLARQNFAVLKSVLKDYNVDLLVGSMTQKEKKKVYDAAERGGIDILVGTHALISDNVKFNNLALCVCDEQQRFGVAQRSALLAKGRTPDVLVMSATPIPRTLSLIFYGDLDITTVKDKPKCRQTVQTNIVPQQKYEGMLKFIEKEIAAGKQAFFVCPKIDGDEEGTAMSVTNLYEQLKIALPTVNIGLLHGKMKDAEKIAVMNDFKDKKTGLLVSTTVIEVGIDVPSASVMVIYNAERFGLSQLHQLRGRVGRSDIKSYCFLLCGTKSETSLERLKIFAENSDGFKISEYDYKLRGAGDFMGSRQSGKAMSDLGYLNYGTEAIFLAKKISDEAFETGRITEEIRETALKKYNKLKDVAMN